MTAFNRSAVDRAAVVSPRTAGSLGMLKKKTLLRAVPSLTYAGLWKKQGGRAALYRKGLAKIKKTRKHWVNLKYTTKYREIIHCSKNRM